MNRQLGITTFIFLSVGVAAAPAGNDKQTKAWDCSQAKEAAAERTHDDYIRDVNACVADGDYSAALGFALRNRKLALSTGDAEQILRAKIIEAAAYRYLDMMPQALELLREVTEDPSANKFPLRLITAYNNAADILMHLDRLEEAEAEALAAQTLTLSHGDEDYRAIVAGTLGQISLRIGRFEHARQQLELCVDIGKRLQERLHQVLCNLSLADLSLKQKNWQVAFDQAGQTILQANQFGYLTELPLLFLVQATAQQNLGDNARAIGLAEAGLTVARERGELRSSLSLLQFLQDVWLKTGDIGRAQQAGIEIQSLSRELFDQRLANTLAAERARFELSSKEREIATLKQQNTLQQANADAARAQRTAAIALSLFVLAVFVIGYSRWMHRRDMQRAEAANRELKLLNDLKDQVLANTSHELRTPLNGIIGLSDILLAEEAKRLSPEAAETLQMIHDCGSQLSHLVDDILDYSRLRADKLPLHLVAANMADLVEEVSNVLRPLAIYKSLVLSNVVDTSLPPVKVDAARIKQVLHNLIGNAIKFTEAGGITISAERQDDWLMVQVKDSGIGIAPDRLERVFEPFEQADGSSNRRFGGAGLGLPIARQLVEAHGGQLTVESQPGQGSIFRFLLPLA